MRISNFKISKFPRWFLLLLFSLLFVLFTISIVIIGIPFYILRPIVKILAWVFNKKLGKMVVSRAFFFAFDDFSTRPMYSIIASFVYDESFEIEKLRMSIQEGYFQNARSDEVAELKQFISKWFGFWFWKKEEKFCLADHVKVYKGKEANVETLTREGLFNIYGELSVEPFGVGKSPWEIIYFPFRKCELEGISTNGEKKSIVFMKFHHAMVDGFSILKLLLKTGTSRGKMPIVPLANFTKYQQPKSSFFYKTMNFLKVFFTVPFETAQMILMILEDKHVLHVQPEMQKRSYSPFFSPPIPLALFKEIKNSHNVSLNSLIYTGFSGAIRTFLLERGMKVPKFIAYGIPLPRPNHPRKLRNHATIGILRSPVGIANPIERLKFVDDELRKLKKSTVPYAGFYLTPLLGSLPCFLAKPFIKTRFSVMISAFAGPSSRANCLGKDVKFAMVSCGLGGISTLAIGVYTMTYCDNVIICTSLDDCFINTFEQCEQFNTKLVEEIKMLKFIPSNLQI